MARERCWKCKKLKSNVELRACDDRLCEQCFKANEAALRAPRVSDNQQAIAATVHVKTVDCCASADCKVPNDSCEVICKVNCCVCLGEFHGSCVGLQGKTVSALIPIMDEIGWVCKLCRTKARSLIQQLQSEHSQLSEEITQLKNYYNDLRAEFSDFSNKLDVAEQEVCKLKDNNGMPPVWVTCDKKYKVPPETKVLAAVHSELMDKQRRASNVVVQGLKPVEGINDVDLFYAICEDNLPIKPVVEKCRRIGKPQMGKYQYLLVTLRNEASVLELLQCAPLLRNSATDNKIFINPDRTPAEALAAYQVRVKQRLHRTQHIMEGNLSDSKTDQLSVDAAVFTPLIDSSTSV
jgi:hypothetical protein